MEKFFNILNAFWDFMNHSIWFPAVLAVAGIVFFAVMYIKTSRAVDKHRAEVQQKIVNDVYNDYICCKYAGRKSDKETAEEETEAGK